MRYRIVCQMHVPESVFRTGNLLPHFRRACQMSTPHSKTMLMVSQTLTSELEAKLLEWRWRSILQCQAIKFMRVPVP